MQRIIVDITPGFRMPTIHFSQGDVGTQFAVDLRSRFGDSLPASPTVTIQATKPSGFGFTESATSFTDGVAVFTTTADMTDEAGRFPVEIKVVKDSVTLFSANFYMDGEATTHPDGTIDGQQETVIPELTQLVERVETAASSVLDMTVEAETLAAGSQATYSYDEATNTATFGIPQGEAGAGAAGVTASAYSSSSTYAVGDYVIHNSNLYRCTTAITTAESFTAAHWTQVVLGDDVSDLKSELKKSFPASNDGYGLLTNYGAFGLGTLDTDGTVYKSNKYRVSSYDIIVADRDITLIIDSAYRVALAYFTSGGAFDHNTGWLFDSVTINANQKFRITIAKRSETPSVTADVMEYVSKVIFKTKVYLATQVNETAIAELQKTSTDQSAITEARNAGYVSMLSYGEWGLGTLDTDGTVYKSNKYRVSSYDILHTTDYLIINIDSDYRILYATFNSGGTFIQLSSWQTGYIIIEPDTYFRLTVAKRNETPSVTADIYDYVGKLYVELYNILVRNNDVLSNVDACSNYAINGQGHYNNKHRNSFLICTDVHKSEAGISNIIKYLNEVKSVTVGVCLGDMASENFAENDGTWYTSKINKSAKQFITLLGNHDGGNSTNGSISGTVQQAFEKFIYPTREVLGISDLDKPYYSITTADGITLIALNNYDTPDTTDSSGNYLVSRGAEVISQAQVDWLLDILDNVPSSNTVVIARHSCPTPNTPYSCNFTQPNAYLTGNTEGAYYDLIEDIVNAWKNGTSLNKTYAPQIYPTVLNNVTVNHDFSSRGSGKFACYIVGHSHKDVIAHIADYPDQLVVAFAASATDNWQNNDCDLPRAKGEKSFDVFTAFSVDPTNKKVNLVRIGSNITTNMVDRTMVSLSYE